MFNEGGSFESHITIKEAFWQILQISAPIIAQQILRFVQVVLNFTFITSYDDPLLLGALGLALYFTVCFQISLLAGMNSAISTLVSQMKGMGRIK